MTTRRLATRIALAGLLIVAATATSSGVVLASPDTNHSPTQDAPAFLDGIQNILQQVDDFLETVADLLRTMRSITGGGEGG